MKYQYRIAMLAYCVGIFWLSHQSSPPKPMDMSFPGLDKVAHMVLYGGLAALVSFGMHHSRQNYSPWALRYIPILFAFAYGVTDELHQYFVPLRTPSVPDLVADLAGAILAQLVCLRFFRWRSERQTAAVEET